MKTRTKTIAKAATINSHAEFIDRVNEAAIIKQKKLALKGEIEKYALSIKATIKELDAEDKKITSECEKYASAHRDELLSTSKSGKTSLAKWGYRAIQKSVKTIPGTTEQEAISTILELDELALYIKYSYSIQKDAILNAITWGNITAEQLKRNGLRIAGGHGENFYLDLIDKVKEELDEEETES